MDYELSDDDMKYYQYIKRAQQYQGQVRGRAKNTLNKLHNIIQDCYVFHGNKKPEYAVICIPGRMNDGATWAEQYYKKSNLKDTVFVGPTPYGLAWYPMPISSTNQAEALSGLSSARNAIESVVEATMEKYNIPKKNIALVGFSAGGVMAVQTAAFSQESYNSVVVHNGAILEPDDMPNCMNNTPYLLIHNQDDYCFDWFERYIPMKAALLENNYKVCTVEKSNGSHTVYDEDIEQGLLFMNQHGISKNTMLDYVIDYD